MSAPEKYMFDNSFDKNTEIIDPLVELKLKFEQKIEQAKAEAFAEGKKAGKKEALTAIESQTKQVFESLLEQNNNLLQSYQEDIKKLEAKSIEFGIAAGTTLASELIKREPMPLIENFFKEAFEIIHGVPEITARLNSSFKEEAIEASKSWMSEKGYEGKLHFIGDDNLKETDVHITWKDGGISQSVDGLMQSIRTALTNYFKAREQSEIPDLSKTTDGIIEPETHLLDMPEIQPTKVSAQNE